MRTILRLALHDLRRITRDRSSFLWMLGMPVAMMWFFGQAGSGSSTPPSIALSVVDRDAGWLARAFVGELGAERVILKEIAPEDQEQTTGKVRTLVIPAGFTRNVLGGEQQTLRLEKDPGSNEEFGLAAQVHISRAIVRTLARLVEMKALGTSGSLPDGERAIEEFRALGSRPPLVSLETSTAGQGRPVPRGFAQSVPGILTMTVLMMTLIYGAVFLTLEKREGTLRRQAGLPLTRLEIYLGKLTGRLLIAGFQIVLLIAVGRYLFGLSWGRSGVGLALVLVSFSTAVAGLSVLLGALLRTPEQASTVGWLLSMLLAGLGGCWWPSEVMPRWLWTAAHTLPTAWAMDAFHALISFGLGADAVLLPCAVLLGFGTLFSVLGARFLRYA